ncbi:MAG: hypothetical protein ACI9UT_000714 [Flavobacteriales bacterium]|jgi:hypothetical protein
MQEKSMRIEVSGRSETRTVRRLKCMPKKLIIFISFACYAAV